MTFRPSSVRDTRRVVFDEQPRALWWTAKIGGAAEPDHSLAHRAARPPRNDADLPSDWPL